MPPRRGRFNDDPYYQIWDEVVRKDPNRRRDAQGRLIPATGFFEHREIADMYAYALDLDAREKREFWADYNLFMVSRRTGIRRNNPENPFWSRWGISPDNFDWHGWREAMGYPHGGRR